MDCVYIAAPLFVVVLKSKRERTLVLVFALDDIHVSSLSAIPKHSVEIY